jgi:hypothetical protein
MADEIAESCDVQLNLFWHVAVAQGGGEIPSFKEPSYFQDVVLPCITIFQMMKAMSIANFMRSIKSDSALEPHAQCSAASFTASSVGRSNSMAIADRVFNSWFFITEKLIIVGIASSHPTGSSRRWTSTHRTLAFGYCRNVYPQRDPDDAGCRWLHLYFYTFTKQAGVEICDTRPLMKMGGSSH